MASLETLANDVLTGNWREVVEHTQACLDSGLQPIDIINNGFLAGMNVVGVRFKAGDMFVPEVLVAAKTMSEGMNVIKPFLGEADVPSQGKFLIGTVKGDLHDIGKNLVAMLMESNGFDVINLGIDLAPEQFIEAVKEHRPDVVGLSALLTTTMPAMQGTIEAFEKAGLRDSVKIVVGGAPVSEEFANTIGADGYAPDAAATVDLVKSLLNK